MLINSFFRIQVLNIKQNLITIFGLSVSMAAVIFSIAYLVFENSYNSFYPDAENIFLIKTDIYFESGRQVISGSTSHNLKDYLILHSPDVEKACRVRSFNDFVKIEDSSFRQQLMYADEEYLEIFGVKTVEGTIGSFGEPDKALITKSLAYKIFGKEQAVGSSLIFQNRTYSIAGIVEDVPSNSTQEFDILLPVRNYVLDNDPGRYFLAVNTFVKTPGNVSSLENVNRVSTEYYSDAGSKNTTCFAVGVTDIHQEDEKEGRNSKRAFIIIAVSVLALSLINFANKFAVKTEGNLKALAVRKSFGASLGQILSLLFSDVAVITFSSLLLGMLICDLTLPSFRDLIGIDLSLLGKGLILTPVLIVLLLILVSMLVSIPSAVRFASITVVKIFNGLDSGGRRILSYRKLPLIFQFVVSLTLISYLLVQALQLKFLSGFDSGIETENRLVITLNRNLMMKYRRFIGNIEEIPGVISVSGKATRFGGDYGADIRLPGWDQETKLVAYGYCVQDNFFEVMGIDLIEGKSFSNYPVRDSSRFIIDKYTANLLGLEDPVGSIIRDDFITGEIVGVVENTNLVSLNKEKRPVVYNQIKDYSSELLINYSGSIENIISSLEKVLTSFDPDYILEYDTLGERMAGFYKNERSNLKLTSWLTALALILCLSGVYSIVSNRVEKERKNISIKKILGASMNDLHTYFGKEIFYLLLLAAAISVPIAYFMSVNWLSDYTERIRIGLLPFVFSLLIVTLLSVLITLIKHNTISSLNPVENLKTE